jgi:hypothetical protein
MIEYQEKAKDLNRLKDKGSDFIDPAAHKKEMADLSNDTMKKLAEMGNGWAIFGTVIQNSSQKFTDALVGWINDVDNVGRSWVTLRETVKGALRDMLTEMQKMMIQKMVMEPLFNKVGGWFGPKMGADGKVDTSGANAALGKLGGIAEAAAKAVAELGTKAMEAIARITGASSVPGGVPGVTGDAPPPPAGLTGGTSGTGAGLTGGTDGTGAGLIGGLGGTGGATPEKPLIELAEETTKTAFSLDGLNMRVGLSDAAMTLQAIASGESAYGAAGLGIAAELTAKLVAQLGTAAASAIAKIQGGTAIDLGEGGGGDSAGGFNFGSTFGIVSMLAGKFASGGSVLSGSTYRVGERGPELFVSKTAGAIVPNNRLGGGGGPGGATVTIVQNISPGKASTQTSAPGGGAAPWAGMAKAVEGVVLETIRREQRQGNSLNPVFPNRRGRA